MLTDAASSNAATPDLADALAARYVGFAGWLRENGFHVTGADMANALEVAHCVGQLDRPLLGWSLRALLCSRADEWRRFDALFDAYFLAPNRDALVETRAGGAGPIALERDGTARDAGDGMPLGLAGSGADDTHDDGGAAEHGTSRDASLRHADFRHLHDADALFAIDRAIRRFVMRLRGIQIRRERRAAAGRLLDMARTIRRSVPHGGVPFELAWRRRQRVKPRIVMLLDVSRSMSLYSFFFLRVARVISARLSDVHCFIFHTQLVGIAQALRDADPWRSQERLQMLSLGWAGGTRIGDSLDAFNRQYAAALLHSRTAVVIVSDGYDAGEPAHLQRALAGLRRRCRCVVWLNPLADRPGFTPSSAGMTAALPFVDLLAGAADLDGLERVLPRILSFLQ
ncbi:VWA domain-containing protein [Burkholderia sp. IDO3]|uniref:vWA domain-containing protein n=1 Tax=Burkholderia sp. IDO3 TaxID=1705310 RepID=UPI000BBA8060|nr:VWA domain-containing protein [Burkholderia sp. IDO3]AXK65129.1 VWA domain-containing protein [Burkholderia sp. IDO3]PCD61773.1 carbon monoxide dehydrogenase [Burkholderia sp. IDO3]